MTRKLFSCLLCAIFLMTGAAVHAQTGTKRERVYRRDLEGIWVNQAYADALKKSRTPHAVAKKTEPVVIAIRREGRSFPMVITNFDRAAVQAVLDIEPDVKPDSYRLVLAPDDQPISHEKVKYMWIRGARNADGKFDKLEMAELFFMKGKWAEYRRVGDAIGPFVNGAVIAGRYTDAEGKPWEFSDAGEVYAPNETYPYELSLNDRRANCDYIEGEDMKSADGKRRIGFAWKGDKLELYPAKLVNKRVRCEPKPFAVLTRKP
jgi:hypothetical protein